MELFVQLYRRIDSTTSTLAKVQALVDYFEIAPDQDKLWTIALFTHRRPKRTIKVSFLRQWAAEIANLPNWLFEESYHIVGDLAETVALILPLPEERAGRSLTEWIAQIKDQQNSSDEEKKHFVFSAWSSLSKDECFLFNKIITGGFRIGVSQKIIIRALAKWLDKEENDIAHRLMGDWSPDSTDFTALLMEESAKDELSKPYPFFLAYALDKDPGELGSPAAWAAEWKWDGIRAQVIKRKDLIFIWSRGEDLVTDSFPEFNSLVTAVPEDFVIDGEIVVLKDGEIQPFNTLQKRLGRKKLSGKLLTAYPIALFAYDILEYGGKDLRQNTYAARRIVLDTLVQKLAGVGQPVYLSEEIDFTSWSELTAVQKKARAQRAEGVMLKYRQSPYRVGRKKGDWWKWKLDPLTIDAVMLYAQRGHGRRSNLFTDFTFAVWGEQGELVPFAKAYSGLTDQEFTELTRFVNANTIERFGPVRSIKPELVFEIAFEGINLSSRHKSGVALRFPRIKRWRRDKKAPEADTLYHLKSYLAIYDA